VWGARGRRGGDGEALLGWRIVIGSESDSRNRGENSLLWRLPSFVDDGLSQNPVIFPLVLGQGATGAASALGRAFRP